MKKKLGWLVFLAIVATGLVQAESFNYYFSGTGSVTITNTAANQWFMSSIVAKDIPLTATNMLVKRNGILLYNVTLNSNTTAMITKSDLAGIWFVRGDVMSVEIGTNAVIRVDTEENR